MMVKFHLAKLLLLLLILSGCRNSLPPREVSEREREAILGKVKDYLQREKIPYPGNGKSIFERTKIVYGNIKTLLQEKPIFFNGLERGFVEDLKDRPGKFWFVGIPISSHRGIIVAVDAQGTIPISYGYYFIGE